jgi:hypothetical protein
MRKIELKSRKLLRTIFGSISLTAMVFIFQACYGMRGDFYEVKFTGTVTSKTTSLPVKGIKVAISEGINHAFTDENGKFDFYASISDRYDSPNGININFLDIDGIENGLFADTTIIANIANKREVKMNVELREIQ